MSESKAVNWKGIRVLYEYNKPTSEMFDAITAEHEKTKEREKRCVKIDGRVWLLIWCGKQRFVIEKITEGEIYPRKIPSYNPL